MVIYPVKISKDSMKQEARNFVQSTITEAIRKWTCSPNPSLNEQRRAVKEYYSLFSEKGIESYNLKATPTADPIETFASRNCDVVLSTDRFKIYDEFNIAAGEVTQERNGFLVNSILKANIAGLKFESEYKLIVQKNNLEWRIFKTFEHQITPKQSGYDLIFCQWKLPTDAPVTHLGALLARFSTYFVKHGLSAAYWKRQPRNGKEGCTHAKCGITAQKLLTAYLFGALPKDWKIDSDSTERRGQTDIRITEPESNKRSQRVYYVESKSRSKGSYPDSLTAKEKDQIDRISPMDFAQYHIVRFGLFKEHDVKLLYHKLPGGRNIPITLWNVENC